MKQVKLVVAAAMAFMLAGCVLRGKQPAKVAAVPPTPAPTAPATPPPPPEPLSIRQTQAQLPEPQPISPEALATIQRSEPPAEAQPEPRTKRPPARPTGGPARQETPPAPAQNAAAAPAEEPRPTVQEIIPPAEAKKLQDSANQRKQEVRKILETVQARIRTQTEKNQVTRIQSFLQLSDEAEKRGEMRQADSLAENAQLLARELQSAVH